MILAVHGITASGVSWDLVAEKIGDEAGDFVAPDLRGRGTANDWGPPYGMASHARDLVALLDERGVDTAVVAGQSMGAFVAVVMAHLFPERVERLVLVDGGLPLPRPEGLSVDEVLQMVIGQAMARLSMTFESRAAYRDFWRAHPALGPYWNEWIERYVDYDLVGEEPNLHSRVSIDAVRGDAEDTFATTTIEDAIAALPRPAVLLRAERGLMDEVPPLIPDELAARFPQVKDLGVVPGTNHYTIVMGETGAEAVAAAIAEP